MDIQIKKNISLKPYNTFGLNVTAKYFWEIQHLEELSYCLDWAAKKNIGIQIIGEGSNLLFTDNLDSLVLVMRTKGIRILEKQGTNVIVESEAGEIWHDFVLWAVNKKLGGLENLSLIPGTVGAAPVQNIGAYGVEVSDICHSVVAIERSSGKQHEFFCDECLFDYRYSLFKKEPDRWIITKVRMSLSSEAPIRSGYESLHSVLQKKGIQNPDYSVICQEICQMRESRLPNTKQLGSAGSFFKNPIISIEKKEKLQKDYPNIPIYPYSETHVKLSAAWLLDTAGWKGKRIGDAGTYPSQALVIVNYGNATGKELFEFAEKMKKDIKERFGVALESEVVILP